MAKYPVVVHGASGYTGMLIMDWLIDQRIPFTAIGRSAERVEANMRERVVRLESAEYEIVESDHEVEALSQAFSGAKVGANHQSRRASLLSDSRNSVSALGEV